MSQNPDVSFDLIAAHTFDALLEVIAGRYITVAQLIVIVECFPVNPVKDSAAEVPADLPMEQSNMRKTVTKYHSVRGKIGAHKASTKEVSVSKSYEIFSRYSTFKVELIVVLFPLLVDVVNFEMIYTRVSAAERGMLLFRLGILNIWNPLKLDGGYSLNLAVREQRQVLKVVILMAVVEPGENWVDETFRSHRHDAPHPDWELPLTWFVETCIPDHGIVSLKYFSGAGTGKNNCAPNSMARMLLLCVCHAQAYVQDAHKFHKPTLAAVHGLNVEFGASITFNNHLDLKDIVELARNQ